MSLPTLLKAVGVHVPRYVTVDGQIVLASPTVTAGESAPLRVEPHRFHGGQDPAADRIDSCSAWWNQNPVAAQRDKNAMERAFPRFVLLDDDGDYAWFGEIDTGRGRFLVLVLPQLDGVLPSVKVIKPKRLGRQEGRRWRRAPHLYTSHALCIADQVDWKPQLHNTTVAVAWTAHWLACYTEWRMSGQWPSDGHVPGAA